jgi:hypothetical protein
MAFRGKGLRGLTGDTCSISVSGPATGSTFRAGGGPGESPHSPMGRSDSRPGRARLVRRWAGGPGTGNSACAPSRSVRGNCWSPAGGPAVANALKPVRTSLMHDLRVAHTSGRGQSGGYGLAVKCRKPTIPANRAGSRRRRERCCRGLSPPRMLTPQGRRSRRSRRVMYAGPARRLASFRAFHASHWR